ncbi:MAG: hypothetical protein NC931_07545, partial [Candidatus Omnitrophica bacterium]|nr:hypothetical protein [Candidatus Omnitrophota bacterium]
MNEVSPFLKQELPCSAIEMRLVHSNPSYEVKAEGVGFGALASHYGSGRPAAQVLALARTYTSSLHSNPPYEVKA